MTIREALMEIHNPDPDSSAEACLVLGAAGLYPPDRCDPQDIGQSGLCYAAAAAVCGACV